MHPNPTSSFAMSFVLPSELCILPLAAQALPHEVFVSLSFHVDIRALSN